jgi:hypothetical protein
LVHQKQTRSIGGRDAVVAGVAGETTSAGRPKLSGFVLSSRRAASIAAHSADDAVVVLQDELRMRQARFSTKSAS